MKYSAFCGFLAVLTSSGCDADRQPAAAPRNRPPAANASPTDGAAQTPGAAIYGEVVAATDEIVEALDLASADRAATDLAATDPAATDWAAAETALRRAVRRFEVAARNWKLYRANTGDAEIRLLEQSRLAAQSASSDQKLRESILREARNPASEGFQGELRNLLRVLRESLSSAERAEFDRWIADNKLS